MAVVEVEVPEERLVAVGMGIVSPLGNNVDTFWYRINNRESGIKAVDFAEYPQSKVKVAGEIDDFGPDEWERNLVAPGYVKPSDFEFYHKSNWGGLEAIRQALEPYTVFKEEGGRKVARLNPDIFHPDRIGIVVAVEGGGMVDEALTTYERIIRRNRNAIKLGLKQEMRERIMEAVRNGSIEAESLAEELVAVADRVMNDRNSYRLNMKAEPESVIKSLPDTIEGAATRVWGTHGPSFGTHDACASALAAMYVAGLMMSDRHNRLQGVVVAGTEFSNNFITRSEFENAGGVGALSKISDPNRTPRPFDKKADGFVLSNAAASIFLTWESFAREHNLPILAYHLGTGSYEEAYSMTSPLPNGEGTYQAYRRLLSRKIGGRSIGEIGRRAARYVNTHGTGTMGDGIEATGNRRVKDELGLSQVGMSSTKGATGHPLTPAGLVEGIVCIQTLRTQRMPPNINCDEPIDEVAGLSLVRESTAREVEVADNFSNGFGGHQWAEEWLSAESTLV